MVKVRDFQPLISNPSVSLLPRPQSHSQPLPLTPSLLTYWSLDTTTSHYLQPWEGSDEECKLHAATIVGTTLAAINQKKSGATSPPGPVSEEISKLGVNGGGTCCGLEMETKISVTITRWCAFYFADAEQMN